MSIELTTAQKEAQATFKQFVDEEVIPHAEQYDREERLPPELIAHLAEQGYLGALLPEMYGGQEMDLITYGLLNEELGRGCSSVRGLVMLQNMIAHTILKWGSAAQKEKWLRKIANGEAIAALALTEPDIGSDAKNVQTTVTPAGDDYIVTGQKQWITFGQIADFFLVLGQQEGRLSVFIVKADQPGFSREPIRDLLGVRATMLAKLELNECRLPKENLVGGVGFGLVPVALTALNLGRYSIAWGCVGIIRGCLEACIEHTSRRQQFGSYLKDHQLIQQMITDMIVNMKAAQSLCYQAGQLRAQGSPEEIMEALAAKYFATTAAVKAANDAVQIHGAIGCHSSASVQRHLRDAKIMEIIEGTTQIHQIKIAEYGYKLYDQQS